jgi:hypothetical protein
VFSAISTKRVSFEERIGNLAGVVAKISIRKGGMDKPCLCMFLTGAVCPCLTENRIFIIAQIFPSWEGIKGWVIRYLPAEIPTPCPSQEGTLYLASCFSLPCEFHERIS